ncbi:phosphate ABC transporter substrate-binding protein [Ferrimonas lipolytica]|uniref:Phosphate ABC transporter substrate-binding protein n=1 Tax=Ferrimonas lipolytica TaxID=2724191 RepID=A0A6H1UBI6_9GAMM|nr:phosphate ABC transporter substrate-binding protein [Ferrimonas lipolytica]QIZ76009.1 phosphate ABC transporter substrate-binding protein [Ferrimonas lipolytica]
MKKLSIALVGIALSVSAQADVVLVGNPAAAELSQTNASKLFLGKMKTLPWGGKPKLIELQDGNPLRLEFHQKVTGKTEAQLKSYWSRLVFTGKAAAPSQVTSAAQVKQQVAGNSAAVGYIDQADVDDSVKVLLTP